MRAFETKVSTFFYRTPCKEFGNTVVTTTGLTNSGYAEPSKPITLATPGLPAWHKTVFEITTHPDHSLAMPTGPSTFEPDVVGTYELLVHTLDDEGFIGCEPTALTLDVRPSSPLDIELLWKTIDDKIPDDEVFGRNVYAFSGARAHLNVYRAGLLEPAFANAQATFPYTGAFWQAGHVHGVTGETRATGLRPIPQMP